MTCLADKRAWAWRHADGEYASGPFDTRDAALADATDSGATRIYVGRVEWLAPAAYVETCLDDVIESMEERAHDQDGWDGDDALIGTRQRPNTGTDAGEQLALALQAWASKWLFPLVWRMVDDGEAVTLHGDDEP